MNFDKNQNVFPSPAHREVWWWAVGMVPPSDSLTVDVIDRLHALGCDGAAALAGCYQWYDYFNALCADMYEHLEVYAPASARQYRDLLEHIASFGVARGDAVVFDAVEWDDYTAKQDRSKAFKTAGITVRHCLRALERTGLRVACENGLVVFTQADYPQVFHAMRVFERSPDVRKTPARHHFAHCEYRQLFKSYAANYDELLRRASDDSLDVAHSLHEHAKALKIQRYIHFGIIKYKHRGIRVLDMNLYGDEYPTLRVQIGTCANPDTDVIPDAFYQQLLMEPRDILETFTRALTECNDDTHSRERIMINGVERTVCPCMRVRINPRRDDVPALLCFMKARIASIEQYTRASVPAHDD